MTEYETILVETRGRVGWITLNRPEALNALNTQVMRDVVAAASAFDVDEAIGAIVLTGSERAFAAGADIKEMESKSGLEMLMGNHFGDWAQFAAVRTPVIAAVSGYALGGGCELAMMCDIIVAADTAKFGQPEINLGVMPGMGGSQRLIRAVGYYKAADLILTGRMMDAAEAERSGLVSRVVPAADLLAEAGEGRRHDRVEVAAFGVRHEGGTGCRDGDAARRGPPFRAARLRFAVRHRRPEGGHGRLPREARTRLPEPVNTRRHLSPNRRILAEAERHRSRARRRPLGWMHRGRSRSERVGDRPRIGEVAGILAEPRQDPTPARPCRPPPAPRRRTPRR